MNFIEIIKLVFQFGGLGLFFWYLIRGLKKEIESLRNTIVNQNKTLEVMEKRIFETEKVGDIYKNLLSDLPNDIENYKKVITLTKDHLISELHNDISIKDKVITELKTQKVNDLHDTENILQQFTTEIPRLETLISKIYETSLNKNINTTEIEKLAAKNAIYQVMSRNVSHNIGSHVLASINGIKSITKEEISNIEELNKRLTEYLKNMSQFLESVDPKNITLDELSIIINVDPGFTYKFLPPNK